jgi:hypothetical protein
VPTHRDLPDDWQDITRRRQAEVDAADEVARDARRGMHQERSKLRAELDRASDTARASTSSPPPGRD